MSTEFKTGDIVRLKSGGPKMTVMWGNLASHHCFWFIEGELNEGSFNNDALRLEREYPEGSTPLPDWFMAAYAITTDNPDDEVRFDIINGTPRLVPRRLMPDGTPCDEPMKVGRREVEVWTTNQ